MVMERWRPPALRRSRTFDEMERLMDEMSAGWPLRLWWRRIPAEEMVWAPSVDMYEKEDSFVVRAELAGVKKEDIDISATGDTLTIKGTRKASAEVKDEEYHRSEVCYGSFSRSITMPAAIDASQIEATYADGILEVRLPKAKEVVPAKIEVKAK